MNNSKFDPSGPPLLSISSRDWWVKVLGMLQHNWAIIEESDGRFFVYFFHDLGTTKSLPKAFTLRQLQNRCGVIDSLVFNSLEDAMAGLRLNDFERLAENPGPWDGYQPHGNFYDARSDEEGIYSRAGYWIE